MECIEWRRQQHFTYTNNKQTLKYPTRDLNKQNTNRTSLKQVPLIFIQICYTPLLLHPSIFLIQYICNILQEIHSTLPIIFIHRNEVDLNWSIRMIIRLYDYIDRKAIVFNVSWLYDYIDRKAIVFNYSKQRL